MKIIIDCMGGDNAPYELVKGTYLASLENDAQYVLVGDGAEIARIAGECGFDPARYETVNAPETVTMEDDPISVVRNKKDSSMVTSLQLLADGQGDALVSTGNTGALFTGATLIVRKIKGIRRPAIGSVLPMENPVLLVDSGANINVSEEYLAQFAVMGSIYMEKNYGIERPRVGLLNNGSEDCKGTPLQIAAYKLLSSMPGINFVGNVEADRVPFDVCDVLVCDGFTGNILLKSIEGMGHLVKKTLKRTFYANLRTKLGAMVLKPEMGKELKKLDPNEYGGAPILGVAKPVIKAHGSAKAKSFRSAIRRAVEYAESGTIDTIENEVKAFMPSAPAAGGEKNDTDGKH